MHCGVACGMGILRCYSGSDLLVFFFQFWWPFGFGDIKLLFAWCTNLVVVNAIKSLSTKSSRVSFLLRAFTHCCLQLNLLFLAKHVPGLDNGIADVWPL